MPSKTLLLPQGISIVNKANGVSALYSDPVEVTFTEPEAVAAPATVPAPTPAPVKEPEAKDADKSTEKASAKKA